MLYTSNIDYHFQPIGLCYQHLCRQFTNDTLFLSGNFVLPMTTKCLYHWQLQLCLMSKSRLSYFKLPLNFGRAVVAVRLLADFTNPSHYLVGHMYCGQGNIGTYYSNIDFPIVKKRDTFTCLYHGWGQVVMHFHDMIRITEYLVRRLLNSFKENMKV